MNKVIEGFNLSLKAEKDALSKIRADIKVDNVELYTTISTKIEKLQDDLVIENKIMDELAEKTQKTKFLTIKLKNATENIAQIEEDRSLVKGYKVFREVGLLRNKGRHKEEKIKAENDQKDNEASGSRKYKGKGILEEEIDENENLTESERSEIDKKDKELDDLNALRNKFEAEEVDAKNAKLVLETHKYLFLAWSPERIQKEATDDSNIYWLDPTISLN
ncbi:unnamed protein product [Lactuca saligna]|uniref:Uncharacterized protein n=1 Tax=Lactuca saligna TaxID=75948 RepID=A0AA36E4G1_LACSI|nr:unnamed protein product [Lactuca saligna]